MKALRMREWEWVAPLKPPGARSATLPSGEQVMLVPNWDNQLQAIIDLQQQLMVKRAQLEDLRRELNLEDEERVIQKHIQDLHYYNAMKDMGQTLLGKLAMLQGVTVKELYPKFDLEFND